MIRQGNENTDNTSVADLNQLSTCMPSSKLTMDRVKNSGKHILDSTSASSVSITNTVIQSQGDSSFYSKSNSKDIGGKCSMESRSIKELVSVQFIARWLVFHSLTLLPAILLSTVNTNPIQSHS